MEPWVTALLVSSIPTLFIVLGAVWRISGRLTLMEASQTTANTKLRADLLAELGIVDTRLAALKAQMPTDKNGDNFAIQFSRMGDQIAGMGKQLAELSPNTGTSLKDQVTQMQTRQAGLVEALRETGAITRHIRDDPEGETR